MAGAPGTWDIVRVAFPHADAAVATQRPALVVASPAATEIFGILWVLMITSARHASWPDDVPIGDLAAAGLPRPSVVRTGKIASIDSRYAEVIGRLGAADQQAVAAGLGGHLAGVPRG